jgi:hypothetical protein
MPVKRPTNANKETYESEETYYRPTDAYPNACKETSTNACKETYECQQRDLRMPAKRPSNASIETYECLQRDLVMPV